MTYEAWAESLQRNPYLRHHWAARGLRRSLDETARLGYYGSAPAVRPRRSLAATLQKAAAAVQRTAETIEDMFGTELRELRRLGRRPSTSAAPCRVDETGISPTIPAPSVHLATRVAVDRAVRLACQRLGLCPEGIRVAWFGPTAIVNAPGLPGAGQLFGALDANEWMIYVRNDLPPRAAAETAMHEIFHAWQFAKGREVSEAGARFFAQGLVIMAGGLL